jgi:hypothetical protein
MVPTGMYTCGEISTLMYKGSEGTDCKVRKYCASCICVWNAMTCSLIFANFFNLISYPWNLLFILFISFSGLQQGRHSFGIATNLNPVFLLCTAGI